MRESVEDLIRQHQKHLFAAAFSVCRNASDADDVVQDTFLKYYLSKKNADWCFRDLSVYDTIKKIYQGER